MDAVLCSLQTATQEIQPSPSRSLRVRLGVVAGQLVNRISIANISCSTVYSACDARRTFDTSTSSDSTSEHALPDGTVRAYKTLHC